MLKGSEGGRGEPSRELLGLKNSAPQSRDKAIIRPHYHARQPQLNWNVPERRKARGSAGYGWRQALMSAGKVVFHSAIQPTKTKRAGRSNPKPGRSRLLADPGCRQTWVSARPEFPRVGVWALLCLPHLRRAREADPSDQGEPG